MVDSGNNELTDNHFKVLKLLIEEKNQDGTIKKYQTQIENIAYRKLEQMSSGTVKLALKRLVEWNLVYLSEEQNRLKRGRPRKFYLPTLSGIIIALTKFSEMGTKIDKIASNNEEVFPEIFGKWVFFKKNEVIEIVKSRLMGSIDYLGRRYSTQYLLKHFLFWDIIKRAEEQYEQNFNAEVNTIVVDGNIEYEDMYSYIIRSVFGFTFLDFDIDSDIVGLHKQIRLIEVIKKDQDLFALFDKEMIQELKTIKYRLEKLEQWERLLNI